MDDYLMTLSDKEFRDVARLMYERFGIHLTEQKRTLVAGRLTKRIRNLGLANIGEYLVRVHADKTGAELTELVDRITTNHSFFYREKDHFEFLVSDVLPAIKARRERDAGFSLRVWRRAVYDRDGDTGISGRNCKYRGLGSARYRPFARGPSGSDKSRLRRQPRARTAGGLAEFLFGKARRG